MTGWFDRLNLQPQERRLVLGAIVVVALVLNYWLVWPFFQDWPKVNRELEEVYRVKNRYTAETSKTNQYAKRLLSLRSMGAQVAPEDAPTRLQVTILTNANSTGAHRCQQPDQPILRGVPGHRRRDLGRAGIGRFPLPIGQRRLDGAGARRQQPEVGPLADQAVVQPHAGREFPAPGPARGGTAAETFAGFRGST